MTRKAESGERAYATIRAAILSGKLPSGSRLKEEELANQIGVSRTPVREALHRLAAGGLVQLVPNRGAFVGSWSNRDAKEMFDLLAVLQGYGARLAAPRINEPVATELRALIEEAEEVLAQRKRRFAERIWEIDRDFHHKILQVSDNHMLTSLVMGVLDTPQVPPGPRRDSPARLARSLDYHREIVSALEAQDALSAESITEAHFLASWTAYITRSANENSATEIVDSVMDGSR